MDGYDEPILESRATLRLRHPSQAKCYKPDHLVDVAMVRDFSGSLDDKKMSRGVLMTTSRFTKAAEAYVRGTPKPITLIDGAALTRLMIRHNVGVRDGRATGAKKLDEAYFRRLRDG
jgi:restriction system protein